MLALVREWLDTFDSVDSAVKTLAAARVPGVPMLSPEEVIEHPHLAARAAFPQVPHRYRGQVRVTATPFHLDGAPIVPAGAAPYEVGEHTRQVLSGFLGYPPERIDALAREGVLAGPGCG